MGDSAASTVIPIIHTVANFQGDIDHLWYTQTLESIKHYFANSKKTAMDDIDICSAYVELVMITALSVGMRSLRTALGSMVPNSHKASAQSVLDPDPSPPAYIRMSEIAKTIRRDPSTGWMPYFYGNDLAATASDGPLRLADNELRAIRSCNESITPWRACVSAPRDLAHLLAAVAALYMADVIPPTAPMPAARFLSRPQVRY